MATTSPSNIGAAPLGQFEVQDIAREVGAILGAACARELLHDCKTLDDAIGAARAITPPSPGERPALKAYGAAFRGSLSTQLELAK